MSKESFKVFVRQHPELVNYVNNNSMTWQKFYDMYDLYGENNTVWDKYFNKGLSTNYSKTDNIKELFNMVRNVDLDSVQKGISGMQKAIGLIQDLGIGKQTTSSNSAYEPRPMYKYFED